MIALNKSGWVTLALYVLPDLADRGYLPEELVPRRHGNTTLNFIEVDRKLFKILRDWIDAIIRAIADKGYFRGEGPVLSRSGRWERRS